jgi:hypothetical protein
MSSSWDDIESLLYVIWRLHVGSRSAMFPAKRSLESANGFTDMSNHSDECVLLRAKSSWLCQSAATTLPAPLDALRLQVGQRLQSISADIDAGRQPREQLVQPPFAELLTLLR